MPIFMNCAVKLVLVAPTAVAGKNSDDCTNDSVGALSYANRRPARHGGSPARHPTMVMAVRDPRAVGAKLTMIVHVPAPASVLEHVLD